ncbi:MAG TPA: hypothetical protein VF665_10665 [Longimicrobium sp.]|uniref:hypothetical protein n=1 Tax=Longimicrobium sp. TaxID=2029185 RepID=UPI002ED82E9D
MPRGGREIIDRARGLWDRVAGGGGDQGYIQHQDSPGTLNHGFGGSRAAFRDQHNAGATGPAGPGARQTQSFRTEFGDQGGQNRGMQQGRGVQGGFTSSPQHIQPYHSGPIRGSMSDGYSGGMNRGTPDGYAGGMNRGGMSDGYSAGMNRGGLSDNHSGAMSRGGQGGRMDYRDRGWDDLGDRGFDPARMSGSGGMGGIVENRGWGDEDDVRNGYSGGSQRMDRGGRQGPYADRHPGGTGYQAGRYERDMGLRGNGFEGPRGGFQTQGGYEGPRGEFEGPRGGGFGQGGARGGMRTGRGYAAEFGPQGGRARYDRGYNAGPRPHTGPNLDEFGQGLRSMYSGIYNEGGVLGQTSSREFDVPEGDRHNAGASFDRGRDRNRR